jgi:UDP-N-acetyl-2-amino-2-deoxyglucuronate dehydrogenase
MTSLLKINKLKIAVVGCGRIASRHFEAIETHSKYLSLVAVCDINQDSMDKHSSELNVDGYLSIENMFKNVELDIVVICTPSGLHPEQTILAAKYGINVVTEKPMATRWRDGLNMVRACDEAGVKLFVVKQNRKNSTLQLLKKAVTEKRFGKIYMVNINVFWTRPQSYYDSAKWRGTWELDGGAFMNQASHYVDLIDWIIGPVGSIQAMTSTLARDIEVEDTGVMNIKWRNGTLGSMNVTMLTYPKNYEGSITIIGENGTVRIGGIAVNTIEKWDFDDEKDYDLRVKDSSYKTTSVYGFGHNSYYKNIIDVLQSNIDPEIDGREGLKSLEILIAAYLSARDGRTVSLPLEY